MSEPAGYTYGCGYYSNSFEGSNVACLMPLPNPFAHYKLEFLKHLDIDGVPELTNIDRWITSVFYHTSSDFKKTLLECLEITKDNVLPTGISTFAELCGDLKNAAERDRTLFFNALCRYGTKHVLEPFIGAGIVVPQQPVEFPGVCDHRMWLEPGLEPDVFQNIETCESMANGGFRMANFEFVLYVMSSRFTLERVQDKNFLAVFFRLWFPSAELRPLVLAHWLHYLYAMDMQIENGHREMIDVLIKRDYCSFPSRSLPTQCTRSKSRFLGIEIAWQLCNVIRPRSPWASLNITPKEVMVTVLVYILEKYLPFVDLELDQCWLPSTSGPFLPRTVPQKAFSLSLEENWLGFTPLMLAVIAGDYRLVVLLVEHGATVTQRHSSRKLSALDLAFRNVACCHPRNG